jgi:hypothetical protein
VSSLTCYFGKHGYMTPALLTERCLGLASRYKDVNGRLHFMVGNFRGTASSVQSTFQAFYNTIDSTQFMHAHAMGNNCCALINKLEHS